MLFMWFSKQDMLLYGDLNLASHNAAKQLISPTYTEPCVVKFHRLFSSSIQLLFRTFGLEKLLDVRFAADTLYEISVT